MIFMIMSDEPIRLKYNVNVYTAIKLLANSNNVFNSYSWDGF